MNIRFRFWSLQREGAPYLLVTKLNIALTNVLCAFLVLLCLSGNLHAEGAGSAYVHGSYAVPQTPQTTVTVAYHSMQFAGDLNLVVVGWNDSTAQVQSVTDTAGNTYTLAVGPTVQQGYATQAIYYAKNIVAANTNAVTVTFTTPAIYPDIRIAEYSGIDPVDPVDATAEGQGEGDVSDSGSITTSNERDLIVAANVVQTLTGEAGAGYISRMVTTPDGDILEDRLVNSPGTYNATASLSIPGKWVMQAVALRVVRDPIPDFIQSNSATPQDPSDNVTLPYTSAQRSGDLNVVVVGWNDSTAQVQSVTDTAGNVYALAVGPTVNSGYATQAIYYAKNIVSSPAAANEVTVVFTAPASYPDIRIAEYSGIDPVDPVDVVASGQGFGDQSDSGFVTTTNAHDLLVAANLVGTTTSQADCEAAVRLYTPDGDILQDKVVYDTGSYNASTVVSPPSYWIMQMVAFRVAGNHPPLVSAGPDQTITLPSNSAALSGAVTDDGLPNNTLSIAWSKLSGPGSVSFGTPNAASTSATFSSAGTYLLQLTASDSQLTSGDMVTVTVNPGPTVTLTPAIAGPDVVSTTQTLTANVRDYAGVPIAGTNVQFTVTGANPTSGSGNTNSSGNATFSYTGTHSGNDTVQATSGGSLSNTATVSWIIPIQNISTSTVFARFFPGNVNQCSFSTLPTATPLFIQEFPTINFNPPAGTIPGNTSGVGVNTRPFTNVTTDFNGNFTGTIVAQGNSLQAGVGSLFAFEAVFTGSFTVASAGNVTLKMFDDDGFILGIGGGATRVSGPMINPPATGVAPFTNLPVVGAFNQITQGGPVGNVMVINFPSAGTYSYELDYNECASGQLSMTMAVGQTNSQGAAPTGSLAITPITPAAINVGQVQTLTVQARDGSGAVVPNLGVAFIIDGANQQFLSGTTNSSGQATLQYTGVNAGTDSVQVVANISGMASFSNMVNVPWTLPPGGGGGEIKFVPQGWIGAPLIGAVVQGQVPITVASGVTLASGTLKYWPTSDLNAVTILNSNTTGSGTIGTFDATLLENGGYTIQLDATSSSGATQRSLTAVDVAGENKLGRITNTVTDFKVPLAGILINISRTYDSLTRGKSGDFGFGWSLETGLDLQVDAFNNATFTFGKQRITFNFAPHSTNGLFPWLLIPSYVPAQSFHGTLTSNGCGAVVQVQTDVVCFPSGESYQPTTFTYTDPAGRAYTVAASGQLQSIKDLNNNTLTFAANGITSNVAGVVVPFIRDGQGRITQITDLAGNHYDYSYDGSGNLASVSLPGTTAPAAYTYSPGHLLLSETDRQGNSSSATYFSDGRLQSITNAAGTTQYAYNLANRTITTTLPDGGVSVQTNNSFGKPLTIKDPLNRTTTYTYDANQNMLTEQNPLSKTWTYTYDANGFKTSVKDPLNNIRSTVYNQFGGPTSITDPVGNTTTVTYDSVFNPTHANDSLGQFVARTFDAAGNPLTQSDANGKITQFVYDSRGNLTRKTDPLNRVTTYAYDSMDRLTSETDPRQRTTTYGYDALGRLTSKTNALNQVTTFTYDNNGNKITETDALNRQTSYQYDALNRLTTTTYADNTTMQYTYNFRGQKLAETDQSGRVTQYQYDLAGQLTQVTYAFGTPQAGTVQYTYDAAGRRKTVRDERNNLTTYNYDDAGRMTSVVDALNHTTTSGYDAANRRTSTTDAANHTTQFAYDARNRLVTTTYPDNTTSTHTYDGMGRELTMTDQAGKITTKAYDDAGQLTFVTDALSHATQYLYDASGNLIRINDANNHSTLFQYDSLNRRVLRWLPIGMAETKEYDAVGNVSTQTDFNGKTTTFTYDTLNRLLTKIPDASLSQPTISYTYTPAGKRATMVDATGTTTYTYDNRNRLTGKATPQGTLSYTYDAHGNVLTIASSNVNGGSMTYTYDSLNRLATVVDNRLLAQGMNPATTSYSYDAIGDLTTYTYPNGVQTIATFDALNRLTQIGSSKTGALSNFAYTLGPAGNRLSAVELGGRTVSYGYDNVYRLISEAIANSAPNNGTVNYTYDSVGNRMQMTSTLGAVPGGTFSYDANDRLALDTWDANGNTISSAGISYVYDFENRLTLRGAVSIVYDGDGNRVSETVGGVPTKYLVDELNPTGYSQVVDELVSGSVVRTYAYGLSRVSQNQFISGTWTPSFYGYDGHGSVRFLADASGVVTDTYQFDAFGNQIASTGTTPNNFLFSGEQLDSSTGLYQLRARWYRPTVGRFITRDPVEGGSCCAGSAGEFCASRRFNPYIYASNDPVNHADPTGQAVLVGTAIRDQYIILGTATGLTALYYALSMARNVNCYLWGEGMITDPFNRQVYLICYYICDDLEIEVEQGEFGVPCPDRIKKKSR